jgi:Alkylmercury lyase
VDEHDLALRRDLFSAFAAGTPLPAADYTSLAAQHVVALDERGDVLMAHPFANHTDGARVDTGPPTRTWWGNCAWDAFGIVAALDLRDATITAQGITLGPADDDAVFHVLVPAAHWWDDIGFT